MANLKKHIKKRFHVEVKLSEGDAEKVFNDLETVPWGEAHTIKKVDKEKFCMLSYDNGNTVLAFPYRYDGAVRWIPEPDPILILFNTAYYNYKKVAAQKKQLLSLIGSKEMNEGVIHDLYTYFGLVSMFVVSLFTSLEAFIYKAIKEDFVYKRVTSTRTELYTKSQLDSIPIDEKIKSVLPQATGKDFSKAHPVVYTAITNLKTFRNSIVHLKAAQDGYTAYDAIFTTSFKYDYESALNAVKDFMNYYHPSKPNYIEECDCSNPE